MPKEKVRETENIVYILKEMENESTERDGDAGQPGLERHRDRKEAD